jgi:hypothetical protein
MGWGAYRWGPPGAELGRGEGMPAQERGRAGHALEGEKGERKGLWGFLFSLFNLFSNLCFSSSSSPKCMFHKFTQQTKYMHGPA